MLATLERNRSERFAVRQLIVFIIAIIASACGSIAQPTRMPGQAYRYLDLAMEERFDAQGGWLGYAGDELYMGARDGAYIIDIRGSQYVWSQHESALADSVMEAEFEQLSAYNHNAYGLACRLDPANKGRGYYFLISGDGHASIRYSDGHALQAVAPAQRVAAIKRDSQSNQLRAVCIGDYLALWVNGELVMQARDRRSSRGAPGIAGMMAYEGKRLTVSVDNLRIWHAALDDGPP